MPGTPENIVDELWAGALQKILPGSPAAASRPQLGDQIALYVLQSSTATVLSANPAFAKVLYTAAYESAARNGYFVIRRLGMPADFFWKFDQWSADRAFSTLSRVMERVFAALMARHNAGLLKLESADIERGQFEVSFASCAECHGATASRPACFFHAGTFAGIMAALLDRRMEAVEVACEAAGGAPCRFLIGSDADRRLAARAGAALNGDAMELRLVQDPAVGRDGAQGLVDLGYYQLLLASAFLPNLAVLEDACMNAGRAIGRDLAVLLDSRGDAGAQISRLYEELRYLTVAVRESGRELVVTATGAPETLGPMRDAALVPFICGELESLLGALTRRRLVLAGVERQGEAISLCFAPEV